MASDETTPRLAVFTDEEMDQIVKAFASADGEGAGVSDELWNEVLTEFERRGRRVPGPYED